MLLPTNFSIDLLFCQNISHECNHKYYFDILIKILIIIISKICPRIVKVI
nr:MAG TPA: hypothetical protein [Bacteriophage sp.]